MITQIKSKLRDLFNLNKDKIPEKYHSIFNNLFQPDAYESFVKVLDSKNPKREFQKLTPLLQQDVTKVNSWYNVPGGEQLPRINSPLPEFDKNLLDNVNDYYQEIPKHARISPYPSFDASLILNDAVSEINNLTPLGKQKLKNLEEKLQIRSFT